MKIDVSPVLSQIAEQRASLQAELAQLDQTEAALKGLTNGGETTTPSTTTAPAPAEKRGPGRPTASAGTQSRDDQAFNVIQQHPEGMKIPEIADAMDIKPNYLYRLLPKMLAEGRLSRDNKNVWRAKVS